MLNFNKKELEILRSLNKPFKIQNFLDDLEINYEIDRETCMSPRKVLETRKAHCIEGALLAAAALRIQGHKPLVVDMTANKKDFDHVVAVFKKDRYWGAMSKTNHATLKYRDPIFKSIRELVMSYFNEYFLDNGKKTLRSYTKPVNLERFDRLNWTTSEKNIWFIPDYLAKIKHFQILTKRQIHSLRKADPIEIEAGKIVEWKKEENKITRNSFSVSDNVKPTI